MAGIVAMAGIGVGHTIGGMVVAMGALAHASGAYPGSGTGVHFGRTAVAPILTSQRKGRLRALACRY